MSAWCRWHQGEVSVDRTIVVAVQESPTGPGWAIRCCLACAHFHNIRPAYELSEEDSLPAAVVAMFIGRRDGLPIAPGGSV